MKIPLNLLLLAAGWAMVVAVGESWWQLAVAAYMGFCYTQTGFVGHDIGHRQVARSRRRQDLLGLLHGNLLMGFSYGWWVGHHNKHHSNPNHLEKDSDITRRRVIFIPEQGPTREGRAKQFIVRHQHVLFYPLLTTEGIGLRTESFKALRRKLPRLNTVEAVLIAVHLVAYVTTVFTVMTVAQGIAFVLTMNLLFGLYIGSVFAPNHKGMPIQMPGEDWDWMTRQVVTSRNIRSSYLTDFLYGGLNYQIEHHLFPAMPRKALRQRAPDHRRLLPRDRHAVPRGVGLAVVRRGAAPPADDHAHLPGAGAPRRGLTTSRPEGPWQPPGALVASGARRITRRPSRSDLRSPHEPTPGAEMPDLLAGRPRTARPTVLVTGASGVVGAALLQRLRGATVIALVHRTPVVAPGVVSVAGDVRAPRLGLPHRTYARLAARVDAVVHCAAVTDFARTDGSLEDTNIDGTANVARFAADAGAVLHHVSTAFIGTATGSAKDRAAAGYAASKLAAEQVVRDSGVPAVVLRPSVVIGDSRTGDIAAFQGLHGVAGAILTGTVPVVPFDPAWPIDFVPCDVVADAIATVVERGTTERELWITAGPSALRLDEAFDVTLEVGAELGLQLDPPRFVSPDLYERLIGPVFLDALPPRTRRTVARLHEFFAAYLCDGQALPTSLPELAALGAVPLPDQRESLRASVRHLVATRAATPTAA